MNDDRHLFRQQFSPHRIFRFFNAIAYFFLNEFHGCHSERSEESPPATLCQPASLREALLAGVALRAGLANARKSETSSEILRYAQNDMEELYGWFPIPESELPIKLPYVKSYQPTERGESPLAKIESFVKTKCPHCGGPAQRETDTMPNWAGSCWYFLAFANPSLVILNEAKRSEGSPPATLCQPASLREALLAGVALRAGLANARLKQVQRSFVVSLLRMT